MNARLKGWMVLLLLGGVAAYAIAEEITLTTYYPSPYPSPRGVYNELRTAGNVQIGRLDAPPVGDPMPRLHLVQGAGAAGDVVPAALRVDDEALVWPFLDATPFLIDAAGNVGIGTASPDPAAKLDVAGSVKIVDGTQGDGKVLTSDATGVASWELPTGVPAGAIVFFDLPACPPGWTETPGLRGRYIVGLPLGGTRAGMVGTPLSNMEDRAAGAHSHDINLRITSGSAQAGGGAAVLKTGGFPIVTEASTGPAGTNAPYIQFRSCIKNA